MMLCHFSGRTRAARLVAALLIGPVTLTPMMATPAYAIVVFDPSNYAQNVIQAARALQQITNQITSLQNQAQMLVNQARNLASLPISSLQQIQQSVRRTQGLAGQLPCRVGAADLSGRRAGLDRTLVGQPVSSGIDLAKVNFRYDVTGDRAPWKPLRAFDDGRQVFIEFPRGIGQGEMPPLFVVGPEGATSELVNYRVRGNYMIVDRLFAAAELRFGSDKSQKRVRISRTDGRRAS